MHIVRTLLLKDCWGLMLSVRTTPSIIRESFVRSTVRFASQCFKTHSFTSTIIPTTIAWWFVNHNLVEVQTGSSKEVWMITIDQLKQMADLGYINWSSPYHSRYWLNALINKLLRSKQSPSLPSRRVICYSVSDKPVSANIRLCLVKFLQVAKCIRDMMGKGKCLYIAMPWETCLFGRKTE